MPNADSSVIGQVDFSHDLVLEAYQHDLDIEGVRQPVTDLEDVYLHSDDAQLFGNRVQGACRKEFAVLLQIYGGSVPGSAISAFVPLVTFREVLCRVAPADDEYLREFAWRLRNAIRSWRDAGAELVHIRARSK